MYMKTNIAGNHNDSSPFLQLWTISNRLSAQRSRLKKAQYINDMEKMVKDLEELISVLTPQIESYKEKRKVLLLQNDSLQKLVEIRSNESKLCEIELEQKRVEVQRLKELEKSLNKNIHDLNFGPQQMQHLRFKQFMAQPYTSLGFYQNGLQHIKKFGSYQFCQQQLPNSALVQSGLKMAPNFGFEQPGKHQQPGFTIKLPVELLTPEKNQEEAEIDQYFNFEALYVDPASASN
ncbi:hypothetical protein Pfo_006982 [Paulownia fortunei]|nr:hypothetical protein Pfo_006982 [Paulownia fortunei]